MTFARVMTVKTVVRTVLPLLLVHHKKKKDTCCCCFSSCAFFSFLSFFFQYSVLLRKQVFLWIEGVVKQFPLSRNLHAECLPQKLTKRNCKTTKSTICWTPAKIGVFHENVINPNTQVCLGHTFFLYEKSKFKDLQLLKHVLSFSNKSY